ncbi:MAG: MBL fold metallo-hydrolase [Deltaproteobacteria bacterium]
MVGEKCDVLRKGDHQGTDMIIRVRLRSGREIFGLATKNVYGGEWDVGPTWNYLVTGEKPFLVDAGRRGLGLHLLEMIDATGFNGKKIETVVLSHGHEDHDGGLFEFVNATGARIMAHKIYERLIQVYPSDAPSPDKRAFPASCWHCPMSESFSTRNCLDYHKERIGFSVLDVEDSNNRLGDAISVTHVPGHAPDAIAMVIDNEAMLVGDTILPDITPHPSREEFFSWTGPVLSPLYTDAEQLYGLRTYMRSLKKLGEIGEASSIDQFWPAHRLYYNDKWNPTDLHDRIDEMRDHHIRRCADILGIVRERPKTVREICREHFPENLLKGYGINMAMNEVLSHCELMERSRDVRMGEDGMISATGREQFESLINSLM